MRDLRAKGLMGVRTYNQALTSVPSNWAGPGGLTGQTWKLEGSQGANPMMAAFFAAQAGDDQKMAANALKEGETYLDSILKRAGTLQQQASNVEATGNASVDPRASRSAGTASLIKGLGGVMSQPGVLSGITGAVKGLFGSLPAAGAGAANGQWDYLPPVVPSLPGLPEINWGMEDTANWDLPRFDMPSYDWSWDGWNLGDGWGY